MQLDNIRVVLVRTFHPGNIGSAARSMKTMGLSNLCLVAPRDYPNQEANKMAAGAETMLDSIQVYPTLQEAVADCTLIVASTARPRGYDLPQLSPESTAENLLDHSARATVALIFGPERMGLHNDDIRLAKYRVSIPANPEYGSLNLAAAVQTLSYEIYKTYLKRAGQIETQEPSRDLPSSDDIERLHQHLEKVLTDIQFLRPHQGETLLRLRTLVARAQPDVIETNILRGILSRIEHSIDKQK